MPIPRFIDAQTGTPYEMVWRCTKCGWAMNTNSYGLGKEACELCGSKTYLLRVDYPGECRDNIRNIKNDK